jgi:hypothetical protein
MLSDFGFSASLLPQAKWGIRYSEYRQPDSPIDLDSCHQSTTILDTPHLDDHHIQQHFSIGYTIRDRHDDATYVRQHDIRHFSR